MLRSKLKVILSIACLGFILGGCAGNTETGLQQGNPKTQSTSNFNWREEQWKCSSQLSEPEMLEVDGYMLFSYDGIGLVKEGENSVLGKYVQLVNDVLYSCCMEHEHGNNNGNNNIELHMHKTSRENETSLVINYPLVEGQHICGIRPLTNGNMAIVVVTGEEVSGKQTVFDCEFVFLDEASQCVQKYSVMDAFTQNRILEGFDINGSFLCDKDYYTYLYSNNNGNDKLFVLDSQGQLVADMSEYKGQIRKPVVNEEGEFFFLKKNSAKESEILWFDKNKNEFRKMVTIQEEIITKLLGVYQNFLYYQSNEKLIAWNLESGERKQILSIEQIGVLDTYRISEYDTYQLGVCSDGKLALYYERSGERYLAILSEELTPKEQLSVTSLLEVQNDLKAVTAQISRELGQYQITFKDADGSMEDYRTRVMADLTAGKGPDVLFVSETDMWILQEKGLLADIRDYMPEELLKQLRENVLQISVKDEGLWGIPIAVDASTLFVNNKQWFKDTWTLSELLALIESWNQEELFSFFKWEGNPATILDAMVQGGISDSEFIDMEKGICDFESPDFIKVLELCKQYGVSNYHSNDDIELMLQNDEILGSITRGPFVYSMYRNFGDNMHAVGFPNEKGAGNYLTCKGLLVVNKKCQNAETVKAYLELIVSEKIQNILSKETVYLRKERPMDDFEHEKEYAAYQQMDAFLKRCVPYDSSYDKINDIIKEETFAFFNDIRTAEETAKIINNRVKLYLKELE